MMERLKGEARPEGDNSSERMWQTEGQKDRHINKQTYIDRKTDKQVESKWRNKNRNDKQSKKCIYKKSSRQANLLSIKPRRLIREKNKVIKEGITNFQTSIESEFQTESKTAS